VPNWLKKASTLKMASRSPKIPLANWRQMMRQSLLRSGAILWAGVLALFALFYAISILSYDPGDNAFNSTAAGADSNWFGQAGAYMADAALFLFGLPAILLLPLLLVVARRLWRDVPQPRWKRQFILCLVGILLVGFGLAHWQHGSDIGLPAGWGGLPALLLDHGYSALIDRAGDNWSKLLRWIAIAASMVGGMMLITRSLELSRPLFSQLAPKKASFASGAKQGDFFGNFALPSIDLLDAPPPSTAPKLDKAALESNARLLESVLDDFKVQGEIVAVRPGPVVTMYELEPAPGVRAQRVVQLAEDIARNMSALSARVSTVPGRTVIGIELPNHNREAVVLQEMIASSAFADQKGQLPIILGKNISGDPVVADLQPMPHLLVAGTTGSGKSVGLNCMILSLLYRLTPDQCRMIMIDPKMLELSIYDDIPHLLAPVVTEPAKAIRALKWAVEQMEDRYRMMSSVGVRNLQGFNEKILAAKAKGQPLGHKVQVGYDPMTGLPQYEEQQHDYQPLPQIVVVVDELADLMMTAGKEVEFLIQRLAQKARAAGIHLIMATQRPSVDVITGVIKANLPTRISFHVTSKIDSRTILGEQGAEQLLGKGDMLYMAGGRGLTRIHGPFVSDDEVRKVADHWRAQGAPDYIQSVTEEPEDGGFALDGLGDDDSPEDATYRKACQIVFESQKASTSWIQRQLRIGYNSAARLIDRMEEDGYISAPNHIGRREVLRDRNGEPI